MTEEKNLNFIKSKVFDLKHRSMLPLVISFALIFVIAFVSLSYAWVFSTYFSNIAGVNIALVESQGLIMTLNGEITQSIDINSYLGGSFSTFSLKEVSSSNGQDIYLRDSGTYYIDDDHIYDEVDVARDDTGIIKFRAAEVADQNTNFIYFDLKIESTGDSRYLIFDSANCYIKDTSNNYIEPIRISLTFIEGASTNTKIIGNRQEYIGNYYTEAVTSIDSITKVGYTTTQNVSSFDSYNGYTNAVFDEDKTLYYLPQGVQVGVIIQIWLEGGDPLCTNSIAGSSLDVAMQFDNIAESEVV